MVDKLTTNGTPNTCFTESDAKIMYMPVVCRTRSGSGLDSLC